MEVAKEEAAPAAAAVAAPAAAEAEAEAEEAASVMVAAQGEATAGASSWGEEKEEALPPAGAMAAVEPRQQGAEVASWTGEFHRCCHLHRRRHNQTGLRQRQV